MIKLSLYAVSIMMFAVLHTLFMRAKLPAYGPSIGTYLDDLSYASLVALLLYLILNLPSWPRKLALGLFVLGIQLVVFGEWWNYEFYRDYIHFASLGHVADWREIANGLEGFQGRHLALWGSLVFLAGAWLLEGYARLVREAPLARWAVLALMALMAAIPTTMFTLHYQRTQIDHWRRSAAIPLNYKNPVMQILRERFLEKVEIPSIEPFHLEAINRLYGFGASEQPFLTAGGGGNPVKRMNVLYITLESVRKYETLPRDGIELTPSLNRIADGNFVPTLYYANSNQTIKAEIALFCGAHDFQVGTSIAAPKNRLMELRCLTSILKDHGYRGYWFHGAGKEFFNRDEFLPRIGFDELHDRFTIEEKLKEAGKPYSIRHWGIEDPYVFDYALETLERVEQPFFAEILTLSNHHPFVDLENSFREQDFHPGLERRLDDTYNRYQHVIHYTDRALGRFWRAFKRSRLYGNTVVVISGDHGIWLFPEKMTPGRVDEATYLYEVYLRLPLVIHFPDRRFAQPVDMVMSQVDVPEIIAGYLGLPDARTFQSGLGGSFLEGKVKEGRRNPVFASIGDNFYYRNQNVICYPPIELQEECDDYLRRCVEKREVLRKDKECVAVSGDEDLLTGRAETRRVDYDTGTMNAVVDFFRKAPYPGARSKDILARSPVKEALSPPSFRFSAPPSAAAQRVSSPGGGP